MVYWERSWKNNFLMLDMVTHICQNLLFIKFQRLSNYYCQCLLMFYHFSCHFCVRIASSHVWKSFLLCIVNVCFQFGFNPPQLLTANSPTMRRHSGGRLLPTPGVPPGQRRASFQDMCQSAVSIMLFHSFDFSEVMNVLKEKPKPFYCNYNHTFSSFQC